MVASFGSPYLIERFPNATTWLAEFSTNDVSQRAAARAIFGQIAIGGQIPVTVPGTVKRGDGLRVAASPMTLQPAPAAMSAATASPPTTCSIAPSADGAFPGGVLAVGWNDELAVHPFGKLTRDAKSPAVTADTIYDVASLTKPIVTTTAIMRLVQRGELDLDAPVVRYLARMGRGRKIRSRSVLARARHRPNAPAARFRPARASRLLQAGQEATKPFSRA